MKRKPHRQANISYRERKKTICLLLLLLCIGGALPLPSFCAALLFGASFISWSVAYKSPMKRWSKNSHIFSKESVQKYLPLLNLAMPGAPPRRNKWKQMLDHCPLPITAMLWATYKWRRSHTVFFFRRQEDGGVRCGEVGSSPPGRLWIEKQCSNLYYISVPLYILRSDRIYNYKSLCAISSYTVGTNTVKRVCLCMHAWCIRVSVHTFIHTLVLFLLLPISYSLVCMKWICLLPEKADEHKKRDSTLVHTRCMKQKCTRDFGGEMGGIIV